MIGRRWVVRGAAATCALAAGLGVGIALAGSGGLDPSFGTGGTTVLERPVSTYPTPTRLAAGGKTVVVTTAEGIITVSRLLADGAPDPSFDGDGKATIESAGFPSARALAIQPDGKIVLIGFTNMPGPSEDATVWRLNANGGSGAPNGALDSTFGTGGTVQLAPFTNTVGLAIAVQPDGKIVAAGRGFNTTGPNVIAVWRLTEKGALDPTFDTDGVAGISDTTEDSASAIALAPDGKILIAGTTELSSAPRDAVVWRLKANGGAGGMNEALDPTFDTDGQADFDSGGNDQAEDVALQPDGKILLAGSSTPTAGKPKATVWRVKPNGGSGVTNNALDPTFDTDGVALIDGGGSASGSALALQPDGKMLLAGSAQVGASPSTAMLWRLLADGGTGAVNGALDPTFGTGGTTAVNTGSSAGAGGLALQPDRRIVVAGGNFNVFNGSLLVFRALGDPFVVNVTKAGSGAGSVQSSPQSIDCGASCSGSFDDGSQVTLTAAAAAGSAFAGWSGAGCGGTGACTLTMSADQTVTATFNALPSTPLRAQPLPATKPTISAVSASNTIFRVGSSSTLLTGLTSAKRHKQGTVFTFRLDQAATVKIAIQRKVPGRRVGRRCVANSRRLRHKPRCTRTITVKTLVRSAHAGLNKVPFSGRIGGKALAPGSYQAVFTASDSAGASPSKALSFTIVRR
jgi:uncharacterized delta-60 repeat protein